MIKHTPGPWTYSVYVNHYERPELAGWAAHVYQDDDCHEDNICKMAYEFDKETTEANATLIAAAPDLLEACEYALNQVISWGYSDGYLANQVLRPAITKAKGGAK